MTEFGTFEQLLDITVPEMRPIALALRELVLGVDPEAVEVVRLGDRSATYGVGPKKMSEGYVYVLPHAGWVNLGFYHAIGLPDPGGLLEGSGTRMRHVKVRTPGGAGDARLVALVRAAREERIAALG